MKDKEERAREEGFIIGAMFANAAKSHDDEAELLVLVKSFMSKFAGIMSEAGGEQSTKGLKIIMWIHGTTESTANSVRQAYNLYEKREKL